MEGGHSHLQVARCISEQAFWRPFEVCIFKMALERWSCYNSYRKIMEPGTTIDLDRMVPDNSRSCSSKFSELHSPYFIFHGWKQRWFNWIQSCEQGRHWKWPRKCIWAGDGQWWKWRGMRYVIIFLFITFYFGWEGEVVSYSLSSFLINTVDDSNARSPHHNCNCTKKEVRAALQNQCVSWTRTSNVSGECNWISDSVSSLLVQIFC